MSRVLLDGLVFPEAPRWRDGWLWFTDQHARQVVRVDLSGRAERVVSGMDDRPGGLGWLPDGTPLVVGMTRRRVHRIVDGRLELHADLWDLASFHCNDMLVDVRGRAWVGNFGYDLGNAPLEPAELVLVEPDGGARVVATDLFFPNGMALTPDGGTLIVAETRGSRLTAFDVLDDGSLANRRVWAELDDAMPDGICLDAQGAVWYACLRSKQVVRIREGGTVADGLTPATPPYACTLGGPERRNLFTVGTAHGSPSQAKVHRSGAVEVFEVGTPGAGLP